MPWPELVLQPGVAYVETIKNAPIDLCANTLVDSYSPGASTAGVIEWPLVFNKQFGGGFGGGFSE